LALARLLVVVLLLLFLGENIMASETESATIMQQAFINAGFTDLGTAQRVNRIKASENQKKIQAEKAKNKKNKNNVLAFKERVKNLPNNK
jgi:hypothetical protein